MKTKILFLVTKSNFGGAQKYVYELATELPKNEFDVVVAFGQDGVLGEKLRAAKIRTISTPSLARDVNPFADLKSFFELYRVFQAEQPDVVHLNSAKASGIGALAARLARVPRIIFTAHGWAFNEDRSSLSRLLIKLFSWVTIMLSHRTIAVSDSVKDDIRRWPLARKKLITIKNGIKEPSFYSRAEARMRLYAHTPAQVPETGFIVGMIAELHKNKGLSFAIDAFRPLAQKYPHLFLFIIGGGEEEAGLRHLIAAYGLQDRVFLLGFVDDAARLLKGFDCLLLSSIKEGLPLTLLEAGLAGIPVIATNVGGIPEVIENEKTGLIVPPRDVLRTSSAIERIAQSPELARSLGTALYRKVSDEFTLEKELSTTKKIYTLQ